MHDVEACSLTKHNPCMKRQYAGGRRVERTVEICICMMGGAGAG